MKVTLENPQGNDSMAELEFLPLKSILIYHNCQYVAEKQPTSLIHSPWCCLQLDSTQWQALDSEMYLSYPRQRLWGAGAHLPPLFPLLAEHPVHRLSATPAVHTKSEFWKTTWTYLLSAIWLTHVLWPKHSLLSTFSREFQTGGTEGCRNRRIYWW